MSRFRLLAAVAALAVPAALLVPGARADKDAPAPKAGKTFRVPYRTTIPKHLVVRVKFNGKGPYNFILDTGAPAMFVATSVAKKAGLSAGKDGWAVIDKLEVEGGVVMPRAKARIETPFQLEGMNGMGLAGVEIHGLMGYQLLAKYRMTIDFTDDKMDWTELAFDPPPLQRLGGGKGKGADLNGLAMMGSMMKSLGGLMGRKAAPDITLRGFYGMTLADGDGGPKVESVLAVGPAGKAGLKAGDVVVKVQDRSVDDVSDVLRRVGRIEPGTKVSLTIKRDGAEREISFKIGEGI